MLYPPRQSLIIDFGCDGNSEVECDFSMEFLRYYGADAYIRCKGLGVGPGGGVSVIMGYYTSDGFRDTPPALHLNEFLNSFTGIHKPDEESEAEVNGMSIDVGKHWATARFNILPNGLIAGTPSEGIYDNLTGKITFQNVVHAKGLVRKWKPSIIVGSSPYKSLAPGINLGEISFFPEVAIARCQGKVIATLEIPGREKPNQNERIIVMKVTSDVIVIGSTRYEKPMHFAEDGQTPSYMNGVSVPDKVLEASNGGIAYAVVQRMHYGGFILPDGGYRPDTTGSSGWELPMNFITTYHPEWTFSLTPLNQDDPLYWAYEDLDINTIKNLLIETYEDLQGV